MEATAKQALAPETCGGQEWIEQELAGLTLLDAQLGGYLARNSDPPPGNETVWRGLTRLVDIQLGVCIGVELVGN
jgi:hypothetical protein